MNRPEFALIDWIRSQVHDRDPVTLGIGDDAACLRPSTDRETLVAIDMLMEGVHFTFPGATPALAGRKAVAVNLSDIAAMGGRPTAIFVSVALPVQRGLSFAQEVHSGVIELANEHQLVIAGGDTNSWNGPLVISVAVTGEPIGLRPVCRSGAKIGDWLFVTGELGGSLPSGRHLSFPPRLAEAKKLVESVDVHSMLDISDGLAADLHHILKSSRVGALVQAGSIPVSRTAQSATDGKPPLLHALSDGEDFELLFSVSPSEGQRLLDHWNHPTPITRIGEITDYPGCWLQQPDGSREQLPPLGWTHHVGS